MEEREVELMDYLDVLWRWKRLIAIGTLACVLAAGLISWALPKTYRIGATIDTGDLKEEYSKDIERAMARINAGEFLGSGEGQSGMGSIPFTAVFKKPFLIDMQIETQSPVEAVKILQRTTMTIIADLNRLLNIQQDEQQAQVESIRTKMERLKRESESLLTQVRLDLDRRINRARGELEAVKAERERLRQNKELVRRRIDEVRRSLGELRAARAEALRGSETPTGVLVLTQLSGEIIAKETVVAQLEQQLTLNVPKEMEHTDVKERELTNGLTALSAARMALQNRPALNPPEGTSRVRATMYHLLAAGGSPDTSFLERAVKRLEVEVPDELQALERQVGELTRKASTVRPARVLAAPEMPRAPIGPRLKLNLAASLLAGLMGSVLLAFFAEYLQQARRRRATGAPAPEPPAPGWSEGATPTKSP